MWALVQSVNVNADACDSRIFSSAWWLHAVVTRGGDTWWLRATLASSQAPVRCVARGTGLGARCRQVPGVQGCSRAIRSMDSAGPSGGAHPRSFPDKALYLVLQCERSARFAIAGVTFALGAPEGVDGRRVEGRKDRPPRMRIEVIPQRPCRPWRRRIRTLLSRICGACGVPRGEVANGVPNGVTQTRDAPQNDEASG